MSDNEFVKAMEVKSSQEREHLYEEVGKIKVEASPIIAFALFLMMKSEEVNK